MTCNAPALQRRCISYHGDSHSRKIFPNTNSPSCVTQAGFSSLMVSWYVASTTNTDIHVSDQLFTSHFTFYFFFEPPPYLLVKFIEHRTRFLILPKLTEFLCRQPPLWKSYFCARFASNWRQSVSSFEVRLKPSGFDRIVFNQIDWIHIQSLNVIVYVHWDVVLQWSIILHKNMQRKTTFN